MIAATLCSLKAGDCHIGRIHIPLRVSSDAQSPARGAATIHLYPHLDGRGLLGAQKPSCEHIQRRTIRGHM
jgi:hypothetical protein